MIEDIEKYHVAGSISGGKDSCAMWLHLREMGVEIDPVFMDTGWESDATYIYLDRLEDYFGTEIKRISDPGPALTEETAPVVERFEKMVGRRSSMVRWIVHKGTFPSRGRRWCTQQLKIAPMKLYLDSIEDAEPLNAVGIRAEESVKRAALPVFEYSEKWKCDVWRPVHGFTFADVVDIHSRHGLEPCDLYLDGAKRLGCWPCIYACKSELRTIGRRDQKRVATLRAMEEWLTEKKNAKRGWFQNRRDQTDGTPWHIDEVLTWANTSRGGRQPELFTAHKRDRGCMDWGLCDTGGGSDEA